MIDKVFTLETTTSKTFDIETISWATLTGVESLFIYEENIQLNMLIKSSLPKLCNQCQISKTSVKVLCLKSI